MLGVNNGESKDLVGRVAQERGYAFPVALDLRGAAHRAYQVTLRPTTAVIGAGGQVLAIRAGAHSVEEWKAQLERFRVPAGR